MKFLTYVVFLSLMLFNVAQAEEITIGIKEAKPFIYKEDGKWTGISIDLIDLLSKEQNFTYKLVQAYDLPTLLANVKDKKVDMAIAAISITPQREKNIDFSHKYFTTSLGILSRDKGGWVDTTIWILKRLVIILVSFIVALYIIGFIISKLEGDDNIVGAHNGAWWALVTFSTTGYGDEVPKTNSGKIIASAWIIASLFLISIFTGYISSTLTVKKLTESPSTLASLYSVDVAVVDGSTAQQKLAGLGIKHVRVKNLRTALYNFEDKEIDAIVHDDAMLSFLTESMDDVNVWSIDDSEEDYAIALPTASPLTERMNLGILTVLASPEWKAIQTKYNVR